MPARFDTRVDAKAGLAVTGGVRVINATQPFFGRTNVVSDTAGFSAVISTTAVRSDSLIFATLQMASPVTSYANLLPPELIGVSCISPGGFFKLANVGSWSPANSFTAMWSILNQSA